MTVILGAVKQLDFSEYFEWFRLAWTFKGFEMIGFTWLLSIVLFIPLAVLSQFLVWRRWRK